jgi:hypothetical protein
MSEVIELQGEPVRTRRGLKLYETNPFQIVIETKKKAVYNKNKDMALIHGVTGEMQQLGGFVSYKEVSAEKFVQLFIAGVKQLQELTNAGVRVFTVLYSAVQDNMGKDLLYLSYSAIDQTTNPMGLTTYNRGMKELISKGFIAPTTHQGMFWLNPNYIYNGDRMRFVQEYRKAPTIQKHNIPELQG